MRTIKWKGRVPSREKLKTYGLSLVVWTLVLFLFYDRPVMAFCGSVVASIGTYPYLSRIAEKKKVLLQQRQFLEFLQVLSSGIESGRSMEEGMEESLNRLLFHSQEKTDFLTGMEKLVADRKNSREQDILLLEKMAEESVLEDLKDFVRAYSICRRTGGDLEQAIGLTCQVIGDKMKLQQELQVLSAQKRMEARIISLMPLLILAFLRFTAPDYITPLYHTGAGILIMTLAILAIAGGYHWTERIMEVSA